MITPVLYIAASSLACLSLLIGGFILLEKHGEAVFNSLRIYQLEATHKRKRKEPQRSYSDVALDKLVDLSAVLVELNNTLREVHRNVESTLVPALQSAAGQPYSQKGLASDVSRAITEALDASLSGLLYAVSEREENIERLLGKIVDNNKEYFELLEQHTKALADAIKIQVNEGMERQSRASYRIVQPAWETEIVPFSMKPQTFSKPKSKASVRKGLVEQVIGWPAPDSLIIDYPPAPSSEISGLIRVQSEMQKLSEEIEKLHNAPKTQESGAQSEPWLISIPGEFQK
jgi:hypothetical protein